LERRREERQRPLLEGAKKGGPQNERKLEREKPGSSREGRRKFFNRGKRPLVSIALNCPRKEGTVFHPNKSMGGGGLGEEKRGSEGKNMGNVWNVAVIPSKGFLALTGGGEGE